MIGMTDKCSECLAQRSADTAALEAEVARLRRLNHKAEAALAMLAAALVGANLFWIACILA